MQQVVIVSPLNKSRSRCDWWLRIFPWLHPPLNSWPRKRPTFGGLKIKPSSFVGTVSIHFLKRDSMLRKAMARFNDPLKLVGLELQQVSHTVPLSSTSHCFYSFSPPLRSSLFKSNSGRGALPPPPCLLLFPCAYIYVGATGKIFHPSAPDGWFCSKSAV